MLIKPHEAQGATEGARTGITVAFPAVNKPNAVIALRNSEADLGNANAAQDGTADGAGARRNLPDR